MEFRNKIKFNILQIDSIKSFQKRAKNMYLGVDFVDFLGISREQSNHTVDLRSLNRHESLAGRFNHFVYQKVVGNFSN